MGYLNHDIMKKILFVIFILTATIGYGQDSSACLSFRKGNFAYRNDSSDIIYIKRTATKQEETNKKKGITTKFKIKWIDACSYEIKQVWSNSKKLRKQNGAVTKVMITSTTKDSYEFTCACKNEEERKKKSGTVVRFVHSPL